MFGGSNKNIIRKIAIFISFVIFVFCFEKNISAQTAPQRINDQNENIALDNNAVANMGEGERYNEFWKCTNETTGDRREMANAAQETYYPTAGDCQLTRDQFEAIKADARKNTVDEGSDQFKASNFGDDTWTARLGRILGNFLIELVGILLRVAGIILDTVVRFTILGMSSFVKDNNAISIGWGIIRDIINLMFIFGLLYISIKTIISGNLGSNNKLLVNIIVAATLINFSFLFTTIAIDFSNYLSVEVYKQLGACTQGAGQQNGFMAKINKADSGISYCFMDKLKIGTFAEPTKEGFGSLITNNNQTGKGFWSSLTAILVGSLFVIILTFVFLALSLMLVSRFIILIFLLITSPVMFLGWVLPTFSDISKKWYSKLTENILYAPLSFLFLLITLSLADQIQKYITGSAGVVVGFIITIGFSIGSIVIGKTLGAFGADFATSTASGVVAGGLAGVGRNLVGRPASALADKVKGSGSIAVATRNTLKSIGGGSFDVRGSKTFTGVATATGLTAGSLGQAQVGGFIQRKQKAIDKRKAEYGDLGKITDPEEEKIKQLNEQIENNKDTQKDMENRSEITKEIEGIRVKQADKRNYLATLDKKSEEYKKVQKEAADLGKQIIQKTEAVEKIDSAIQARHQKEVEEINKLKDSGKNRQKEYLARISGDWKPKKVMVDGTEVEDTRLYSQALAWMVNKRRSSTKEAYRIIGESAKRKDGGDNDLDKIIKAAKDANKKKGGQQQNNSVEKKPSFKRPSFRGRYAGGDPVV